MNVSMAHCVGTFNCHRRLHMAMQRGAHHCAAAQRTVQHTLEMLCCVRLAQHSLPRNACQAKSLAALTAPLPSTRVCIQPLGEHPPCGAHACTEASVEPFRGSTLRFGVCILPPRGLGEHISEACMAVHESGAEISKTRAPEGARVQRASPTCRPMRRGTHHCAVAQLPGALRRAAASQRLGHAVPLHTSCH